MLDDSKLIWMDGKLIPWKDATVHVLSHTLHYGNAVFEGTRAYKTEKGLAIFRLRDHTKRLLESAKITLITPKYSLEELEQAQIDVLKVNNYNKNVYIRPLIFLGYGKMGVSPKGAPRQVMVATWEWGSYLGDDGIENGIKVKISSFSRYSVKSTMGKAKAAANYLNSQMANEEAVDAGYDEALLLDEEGFVAEGSGECFFIVKNGVLISPPNDYSLNSITQDTTIQIANKLSIPLLRRKITRDEVYTADEAFFTGTAAEITPINNVDGRVIGNGKRGPITEKLQKSYFDIVYGRDSSFEHFLTYVK